MIHVRGENLCKDFEDVTAVDEISFEARSGYILGILGPANAGKTTLLRLIMNILKPDSGTVAFDDQMISNRVRQSIGYLPQRRGLYNRQTLNEVLRFYGRLKNLSYKKAQVESVRLLDRLHLIDQMDSPIAHLSEMVQQKAQIMMAIIHNPDLLILDEPFSGQHPETIKLVRKLLQHFQDEGKTIIIASNRFEESELVCDEVVMMQDGRSVLQASLGELRARYRENVIEVEADDNLEALQSIYGVKKFVMNHRSARLYVDNKVPPQKMLDVIVKSVNATRIHVTRPSLEDIFNRVASG